MNLIWTLDCGKRLGRFTRYPETDGTQDMESVLELGAEGQTVGRSLYPRRREFDLSLSDDF